MGSLRASIYGEALRGKALMFGIRKPDIFADAVGAEELFAIRAEYMSAKAAVSEAHRRSKSIASEHSRAHGVTAATPDDRTSTTYSSLLSHSFDGLATFRPKTSNGTSSPQHPFVVRKTRLSCVRGAGTMPSAGGRIKYRQQR